MKLRSNLHAAGLFWAVVACGVAAACASAPQYPAITPLPLGPLGSEDIAFHKVIIRLYTGTRVGAHHEGLLNIPKVPYYWPPSVGLDPQQFNLTATATLEKYGYSVLSDSVFDQTRSAKARFQLTATITHLEFDTYSSVGGASARAWLDVEWHLYDTLRDAVVLTRSISEVSPQTDEAWRRGSG